MDVESILSIVVLGASGDLAKKLVLPALVGLCKDKWLPASTNLVGYARSPMSNAEFATRAGVDPANFKITYVSGEYGRNEDFQKLDAHIKGLAGAAVDNRIFYLAVPPNVFLDAARCIHAECESKTGWTRVVVEKPFGRDLASSQTLMKGLGEQFKENQVYRIDHYLGKELVQENFGTVGRGGYFDNFGIIRDLMQNHMIQVMSLVAMEPPASDDPDAIRDEKVRVLRATKPIAREDIIIGQYVGNGKELGYKEEEGVPKDSRTPTFAIAHIQINNQRWKGVPFILKCGKGLDKKKAEVRIQFKPPKVKVFPQEQAQNELVIRVQPQEAIYMKMISKRPGMKMETVQSELDLTYHERFDGKIPTAYEKLIHDVYQGNQSLFVREDELHASWIIFDQILKDLETSKDEPLSYTFGTRGPAEADEMAEALGHKYDPTYKWSKKETPATSASQSQAQPPQTTTPLNKATAAPKSTKSPPATRLYGGDKNPPKKADPGVTHKETEKKTTVVTASINPVRPAPKTHATATAVSKTAKSPSEVARPRPKK